ncbi:hypothetical protein RvY_03657-2 [Ramazzottius varieornatus]|uniref:Uncharacterized protein n=1 Tax=Ramazzottius varieornatus TaxID=947166 RepID=A0A1D1UZ07_RAMVA|nr:hypothetical protein RvY_03657-2 [Ramazzottius varieornatus]
MGITGHAFGIEQSTYIVWEVFLSWFDALISMKNVEHKITFLVHSQALKKLQTGSEENPHYFSNLILSRHLHHEFHGPERQTVCSGECDHAKPGKLKHPLRVSSRFLDFQSLLHGVHRSCWYAGQLRSSSSFPQTTHTSDPPRHVPDQPAHRQHRDVLRSRTTQRSPPLLLRLDAWVPRLRSPSIPWLDNSGRDHLLALSHRCQPSLGRRLSHILPDAVHRQGSHRNLRHILDGHQRLFHPNSNNHYLCNQP